MNKRISKKRAKDRAYKLLKDMELCQGILYLPEGIVLIKVCSISNPTSLLDVYQKIEVDGYIMMTRKGPLL